MNKFLRLSISHGSLWGWFVLLGWPGSLFSQSYINSLDLQINDKQRGITTTDGYVLSYYELKVTNYGFQTVEISKIARSLGNQELDSVVGQAVEGYVVGTSENYSSELLPGQTMVIFLNVKLEPDQCGATVDHTVEFVSLIEPKKARTEPVSTTIDCSEPVYIASPFKDGRWTAIYSPQWHRGHRRVIYATRGKAVIPGRYAIDFVKVDEQGGQYQGDKDRIENYCSYGETVYSGAAGTVVGTRNDFFEYNRLSEYIYPDHREAAGNFVIVRTDEGRYLHYEHLKPTSVTVSVGQRVTTGEEIGQVGFTGGTTSPHLHVHVSDGPDFLSDEGLPFGLERYESVGHYPEDGSGLGAERWKETTPSTVTNARPEPNEVIRWEQEE